MDSGVNADRGEDDPKEWSLEERVRRLKDAVSGDAFEHVSPYELQRFANMYALYLAEVKYGLDPPLPSFLAEAQKKASCPAPAPAAGPLRIKEEPSYREDSAGPLRIKEEPSYREDSAGPLRIKEEPSYREDSADEAHPEDISQDMEITEIKQECELLPDVSELDLEPGEQFWGFPEIALYRCQKGIEYYQEAIDKLEERDRISLMRIYLNEPEYGCTTQGPFIEISSSDEELSEQSSLKKVAPEGVNDSSKTDDGMESKYIDKAGRRPRGVDKGRECQISVSQGENKSKGKKLDPASASIKEGKESQERDRIEHPNYTLKKKAMLTLENDRKDQMPLSKGGGAMKLSSSERLAEQRNQRYSLRQLPRKDYTEPTVPNQDDYLFCDECNAEYEGDCPEHGPLVWLADEPVPAPYAASPERADRTAPPQLEVSLSSIPRAGRGVWVRMLIPKGLCFGPYEGVHSRHLNEEGYCWQVKCNGVFDHYVDAGDKRKSNWMRFVNCARRVSEQNVIAFQFKGNIYYRTFRDMQAHEEMLVWYGDEFAQTLGISPEDFHAPVQPPLPKIAFPCSTCRLSFASPLYLCYHQRYCRGKQFQRPSTSSAKRQLENRSSAMEDNSTFPSKTCRQTFDALEDLRRHNEVNHKEESCNNIMECEILNESEIQLQDNKINDVPQGPCKPFVSFESRGRNDKKNIRTTGKGCRGNESESGGALVQKWYFNKNQFVCAECGKEFVEESKLEKHKKCHSKEKSFVCSECGRAFSYRSELQRHCLLHSGERPFSCGDCGKSFTRKGHLKRHERTHTGEKPFSCSECGKSFTQIGHLISHKRKHSDERPFLCHECGKAFSQSSHLTTHMRIHTGERPYACSVCGKCFTESGHLTTHMRIHSGEQPFACSICEKRFSESSSLSRHRRTVHKGTL